MLSDLLSRTTRMGTRMGIRLLATALCLLGATAAQTQTQAQDGNAPSADTLAYITRLQQQARAQHLADSPTWRSLMHFAVQPLTRQDRSLADDHGFFLSPQGHSDLQAELDATLVALADTRPLYVLEQPAACRFMARQTWLRQQLHIDPQRLPEPECARYQAWREGIRAKTVTLVFPSAYINSPASMYGHTFLRLDPPPTPRGQLPLMSYSVSYAANGSESDGITFAIRGLTGLYDGQFTTSSYYAKLTEYSDLENRDVWEYELDLNDEEVDRMMAHTWELGATRFDYYFFDENCAYHLLSLLDAARPGMGLSEQFVWRAIPSDTVRAVQKVPGLVRSVRYRPSNSSELRARVNKLGPTLTEAARQLAEAAPQDKLGPTPLAPLQAMATSPAQQALVLETAERLVAYEATRNAASQHDAVQAARMRLLVLRAGLPAGDPVEVPRPAIGPTEGHATIRADWQQGQRQGHAQTLLRIRPAYHDLMDPEAGYQRGAAIDFFSLTLGKRSDRPWEVERFMPVAIQSLAPREAWMAASSWRVEGGLLRTAFGKQRPDGQGEDRPLAGSLRGGPGLSWDLGGRWLVYGFLDNQAWWDKALVQGPWALGSGLALGTFGDLSASWRVQAEGFARAYLGGALQERGALFNTRWQLNADWNLTGQCQWLWRQEDARQLRGDRQCTAGLQRYF
jgi:hypothetical protein